LKTSKLKIKGYSPKVSIIIPTYNRSNLVKKAVNSVLRQTLEKLELIIVDDGSTDNTARIIKQISDKRIRYIYKKNGGVSSARNLGILACRGEDIAFLDDDDIMPEDYLQTMVHHLDEKKEYGIAFALFINVDSNGRKKEGFGSEWYISGSLTRFFFDRIPQIPSAIVCRKSLLKKFYFDEQLKESEDSDFFLRISTKTKFLFVPGVTLIRRITPGSLSCSVRARTSFSENWLRILERFYFHLGGDQFIPFRLAKIKIARQYYRIAKEHYKKKHRKAAIFLCKRAIIYTPLNLSYYRGLLKALLLSKSNDGLCDWQMPKPLKYPESTINRLPDKQDEYRILEKSLNA